MATDDLDREPVWLNEPARWRRVGAELVITTDAHTDFWRHTHYGFVRDNGHLYGVRVLGGFTAEVTVEATYAEQYDQAGLMVRMDAERWVKCGIERVDGALLMSAVVTHAVSDWSTVPLAVPSDEPARLGVRLTRAGDALTIACRTGEGPWRVHRVAFLPPGLPVSVGPMAASPTGDGFEVRFLDFTLVEG